MSPFHSPGPAGEITQARVREELAASEAQTVPGTATPPQTASQESQTGGAPEMPATENSGLAEQTQAPPLPEAAAIDAAKIAETGRVPLNALPDSDLVAVCNKYMIPLTADVTREQVIAALNAKGIVDVSSQS